MKIVFVCTGNTCRSPLAQGLMQKKLDDLRLNNIEVTSAGLAACAGDEVSASSVEAAKKYGVDISAHRARALSSYMLDDGVFFCMSRSHMLALLPYVGRERVFLLGDGIADPFLCDQDVYDRCAEQIYSCLDGVLKTLISTFIEISPMQENDISQIAEIERLCFSQPWSENGLRDELDNENAHFLSAHLGSRVLGYIGIIEVCGVAEITNVAVHPEFRRMGIAERMLKEAENGAKQRSCDEITLEVRLSNDAAISLYSKRGYSQVGKRPGFYDKPKEDALLMTKYFSEEKQQ